jgi:hypothetical protein
MLEILSVSPYLIWALGMDKIIALTVINIQSAVWKFTWALTGTQTRTGHRHGKGHRYRRGPGNGIGKLFVSIRTA